MFTDVKIAEVDHLSSEPNVLQMTIFCLDDVDVLAPTIITFILQYDLVDHVLLIL